MVEDRNRLGCPPTLLNKWREQQEGWLVWARLVSGNALMLTCSFVAPCPKYPADCSEYAASLSTVGNQKQNFYLRLSEELNL